MKAWGFERKRKQCERAGKEYNRETDKLVCAPCVVETGPELTRLPTHCQLLSLTTTTNPFQQTKHASPNHIPTDRPTDRTHNSHLHRRTGIFLQSNLSYTIMSISSKLAALSVTYPYQVVRSRIQVRPRTQLCGRFSCTFLIPRLFYPSPLFLTSASCSVFLAHTSDRTIHPLATVSPIFRAALPISFFVRIRTMRKHTCFLLSPRPSNVPGHKRAHAGSFVGLGRTWCVSSPEHA
jgi:hypothetical protein